MTKLIANYMINQSIIFANINLNEDYLLDFYKLAKLMYIAQGIYLTKENRPLFKTDFIADSAGPYLDTIEYVFFDWELNPITKGYEDFPLPPDICEFLDDILQKYGFYNRRILGIVTKSQKPWQTTYVKEKNSIIDKELMKNYFSKCNLDLEFSKAYELA